MDALEKAIEILNDTEADMKHTSNEINFAHLLAIKMIKKQIPKPPREKPVFDAMRQKRVFEILCPVCDESYGLLEFEVEREQIYKNYERTKYCIKCGQKINWRVSE